MPQYDAIRYALAAGRYFYPSTTHWWQRKLWWLLRLAGIFIRPRLTGSNGNCGDGCAVWQITGFRVIAQITNNNCFVYTSASHNFTLCFLFKKISNFNISLHILPVFLLWLDISVFSIA